MSKMKSIKRNYPIRQRLSLTAKLRTSELCLRIFTCYIDLDLQMSFIRHRKGGPLGNYSALHSFGNHSGFTARVPVTRSNILFLNITGSMKKIMD